MTPERRQEVERLLRAAEALPPDRRAAFLSQTCGSDLALRREVEELLTQAASHTNVLSPPILAADSDATRTDEAAAAPVMDQQLGVYRITGRLGAGGMGEVLRARDIPLGREVAIKILPRAFTTDPERLARFEREA